MHIEPSLGWTQSKRIKSRSTALRLGFGFGFEAKVLAATSRLIITSAK